MVFIPRSKVGHQLVRVSHRAMMRADFNWQKIQERCVPQFIDLPDEIRKEIYNQVKALERGVSVIKKCYICGRLAVLSTKNRFNFNIKNRSWCCTVCKLEKMKIPKKDWFAETVEWKKRNDKLQKPYEVVWNMYLEEVNRGVKITKLN